MTDLPILTRASAKAGSVFLQNRCGACPTGILPDGNESADGGYL